ncbi:uncharacterized protein B0T15DRAFT_509774 [Chaetomium strumarium]|uniref:Aminoglycoside phosphotransferase domain-containing protein n=1 Tax=Chaetomium strumarium TaxID=1170767 RepID=A0AAJ0GUM9_9PEZI|nr:hypothetical protein B0T15DRAFT_509774 [Chaetomium strumarium]
MPSCVPLPLLEPCFLVEFPDVAVSHSPSDSQNGVPSKIMDDTDDDWKRQKREIIDKFFYEKVPENLSSGLSSTSACNEVSCIQFAKTISGTDDIAAVDNQGSHSFTVSSPRLGIVVQFRLKPLRLDTIRRANEIYGNLPKPYAESSWTKSAKATVRRLMNNTSLRDTAPELYNVIGSHYPQLHLLDTLPAVLTHHDFASVNILVDDSGHLTGVIDFDEAAVEAFGMCVWGLYECFFGSMDDGKWSFYDVPADDDSGRTIREVLEQTFWESLWTHASPNLYREEAESAVKISLSIEYGER